MTFLTFALSVLLAAPASDTTDTGRVTGRVVDQTGAALPGVSVDLVAGTRDTATITDSAGSYVFENVPAGRADIIFRLLNFTVLRRAITVERGQTTSADATLTLSLNADVIVTASSTFRNLADVERPAENLLGIASSASQGAITAAQLDARPVMRAGEVLETVPGLIVTQHSGEGKANQYYLRAFNLDHGTDFSTTVAGIPVNMPTGAHAHGYADASFLIPELVSGLQFRKGPYFADEGDFSAAGAAHVSYFNVLDAPQLHVSTGKDGWARLFAAASPRVGAGHLLAAVELNSSDGPWVRPDNYQRVNTVLRYSRGDNRNGLSLTAMTYSADWDSTDQIPQRAVTMGLLSRYGTIDTSDGGMASRQSVAAEWQRSSARSSLRATGFALGNQLNLFSNFTYFLDDPEQGDQFEQAERRVAAGGRVTYRRLGRLFDRHVESSAGVQLRHDRLRPVGLYRTVARQRISTTREDRVRQTMLSAYAQSEIQWFPVLRTTLGLRADDYRFNVDASQPLNAGHGTDSIVSPKAGLVVGPWAATEFYVNAGRGFHSNDARGTTIRVDPVTGDAVNRVSPLVRATGAEIGIRTVRLRRLQSTLSLWTLALDSELLFVGDAGTTEASRPSRRTGIEWTNYARPTSWLVADADFAFSRARFSGAGDTGKHVPGAPERVISAGVNVDPGKRVFASLRVRHFGARPLTEDASVSSRSTTLWNSEIGYRVSAKARVVLELFNIFDATASDIDYFYTSRLPGEPSGGVDDIHTHPALPRSVRLGLHLSF